MLLKERLQEQFDTSAISVQVIPFNTWNQEGKVVEANQLIVLDAQDRFMFLISYASAPEYLHDGFVNHEKIYQDFILTEKQWEALHAKAPVNSEHSSEAMPADVEAVLK